MAVTTKVNVPLAFSTGFDVPMASAIDDGAGAYGTAVNAGSGLWKLGSTIPKGRALLVSIATGTLTGAPTNLRVSLFGSATDNNGSSGARIAASSVELGAPASLTHYSAEISLEHVTDLSKYYSIGLESNGAGTTSVPAGTVCRVLDPTFI